MVISAMSANLAISIAEGLIKLGVRVDQVLAENAASNSELAILGYRSSGRPGLNVLIRELESLARNTPITPGFPDPLGDDRAAIEEIIRLRDERSTTIGEDRVIPILERTLPDLLIGEVQTDGQRVEFELKRFTVLEDVDIKRAAYFLGPGRSNLGGSVEFRLAMLVVDVLAEFTQDTQQLFIKDERSNTIIRSVLTRFAKGDLEDEVVSSELLLRRLMMSTLNGAMDARESWTGHDIWLNAALDALDEASNRRDAAGNEVIDDEYLIGLLQGRGYRHLISELLEEGGEVLASESADRFKKVLADVLAETAPMVRSSHGGFEQFFQEHWADISRAGLRSVSQNGSLLLDDAAPILKTSLIAITKSLANTQGRELLSAETLTDATEAAIAAMATNPEIMGDESAQVTWATTLFSSFASIVADQGLQTTFSSTGLKVIVRLTAQAVAQNPELIVKDPGLAQKLTTGVLKKVAAAKDFRGERIATLAIKGILQVVANNPNLLDTKYADVVGDIAGQLAGYVHEKSITGLQVQHLVDAITVGIAENSELFVQLHDKLALAVVKTLVDVSREDNKGILAGAALAQVGASMISLLAARGSELLIGTSVDGLAKQLANVLRATLAEASQQLGRRVDVHSASLAIRMVLEAWARGEIAADTFEAVAFERFFGEIADFARTQYELPHPRMQ